MATKIMEVINRCTALTSIYILLKSKRR